MTRKTALQTIGEVTEYELFLPHINRIYEDYLLDHASSSTDIKNRYEHFADHLNGEENVTNTLESLSVQTFKTGNHRVHPRIRELLYHFLWAVLGE